MNRQIIIFGQTINYNHKRIRHSKRVRLLVSCDARVTVTTPVYYPVYLIERFLHQKSSWVLEKIEYWREKQAISGDPISNAQRRAEFLLHKSRAYYLVKELITKVNAYYNFSFQKITIRNQKSRWGSCSLQKTLNFNYRIALLPEHLSEYIVAHELCHLKEMNHSSRFWNLLSRSVPDFQKRRKELKQIRM